MLAIACGDGDGQGRWAAGHVDTVPRDGASGGAASDATVPSGAGAGAVAGRGSSSGSGGAAGPNLDSEDVFFEFDANSENPLFGAPLVFAPNAHSFGINAIIMSAEAERVRAFVREAGEQEWEQPCEGSLVGFYVFEWICRELRPGTVYEYVLSVPDAEEEFVLYSGSAVTQREQGSAFTFALLTDTHISPREVSVGEDDIYGYAEQTLQQVAVEIGEARPDFVVHLGDVLDFHRFGFVVPPPSGAWTTLGYMNYRRLLGDSLGNTAHYTTVGNWDGENGSFSSEEVAFSRDARMLLVPGPTPSTYPEGGSEHEDYYALQWGDALLIVLNVMSYTPAAHRLGNDPGAPDDWTLGEEQLAWLERTLENATSRWRFVLAHHTVGGAAGDAVNSAYGRGGGQAAYVGEQAIVHELMLNYGVQIFFYGHDHVFTDMIVDDIHYALPGSAGAPWLFSSSITGYTEHWASSGHALVHVDPDSVDVEFIALGGEQLHRFSVSESP